MKKYVVDIMEYDGWLSLDEQVEFDTRKEAVEYCNDYNQKYNSDPKQTSSGWSMYAKFEGTMYPTLWQVVDNLILMVYSGEYLDDVRHFFVL